MTSIFTNADLGLTFDFWTGQTYVTVSTVAPFEYTSAATVIGDGNQPAAGALTTITAVTIGTTVTSIANNAFKGCSNLVTITNNSTVLSNLGGESLIETSITSFIIPNTVTTMGNYVFDSINTLLTLTIGSSVPAGVNFGVNGPNFQSYTVDSGSVNYSATDGVLYNREDGFYELIALPRANVVTILTIPEGVARITNCNYNNTVTKIIFPLSVGIYMTSACSGNTALTEIIFPDGANPFMPGDCFASCAALTDITIPNSFVNLLASDFDGCTLLKTESASPYAGTLYSNTIPGDYIYDLFLPAGTNGFYLNYDEPPVICFKEDSKILTDKGYKLVQDLRKGDLVKTLKHGFVPINMIGKKVIYNPSSKERIKDQLYKCSKDKFPEVFEDLVITGCHSILIDNCVTPKQIEQTKEVLGGIYITDDKFRYPACIDERTSVYEVAGKFTIYHIALDHDNYFMNYGIYANGLLVESISQRGIKDLSDLVLIE
jgi:hypothetical protein